MHDQRKGVSIFVGGTGLSLQQFRRKGNEYSSNLIQLWRTPKSNANVELTRIKTSDKESKNALQRLEASLEEGSQAIAL